MRSKTLGLLLTAALVLVAPAAFAAVIWDLTPGTGAPPGTLGGYSMTPFGDDPRPNGGVVPSVPSPLGGVLGFAPSLTHVEVGAGWATWSHGYSGDVYYDGTSVTLTLPADTAAFYFYAEPDPFGLFTITATSGGVSSGPVSVDGFSGARYFGVYTTGAALTSITVSSSVAFAVGEFGIAKCKEGCDGQPVPEPSSLGLLAAGALTLLARRRRKA